jgi:hypothetical protein
MGHCLGGCNTDGDCPGLSACNNNRCTLCEATCASDADCTVGAVCVHRNSCTFCEPRDAGAGGG